jgi:glycosyltransferase involved in cell wall biosynthesis
MLIHATNITGVGASHVVVSFLDAASDSDFLNDAIVYLPTIGPLAQYEPYKGHVIRYKRHVNNNLSRLFECVFARFLMPKTDSVIVLGDIPLTGIKNQVVFVHQPNLILPKVNELSSRTIIYRILRLIFKFNIRYVKKMIVQTGVMAEDLIKSYPQLKEKIIIMPQPVPNWFKTNLVINKKDMGKLILFYPAAGYAHKNHRFLIELNEVVKNNENFISSIEIWLTLSEQEMEPYNHIKFVKNLGRLVPKEILSYYNQADALLFISKMESYGFPLVEALFLNKPIIAVDLPYARWLCQDVAYYFNPNSVNSFLTQLEKIKKDLYAGYIKSYQHILEKFPLSWSDVVKVFEHAINQ